MINKRSFLPKILIYPWETLEDFMKWEQINNKELSKITGIKIKVIDSILNKDDLFKIDVDVATRLYKNFGISKEFWLNIQNAYEKDKIRLSKTKKILSNK